MTLLCLVSVLHAHTSTKLCGGFMMWRGHSVGATLQERCCRREMKMWIHLHRCGFCSVWFMSGLLSVCLLPCRPRHTHTALQLSIGLRHGACKLSELEDFVHRLIRGANRQALLSFIGWWFGEDMANLCMWVTFVSSSCLGYVIVLCHFTNIVG